MVYKKVATTVIVTAASVGSYLLFKNKENISSDDVIATVKDNIDTINKVTKTFAGVTQDEVNSLAKTIYRGVKAVIKEDKVTFVYNSASGKTKNISEFTLNAAGEMVGTVFSNMTANAPRQFGRALDELIKSKNKL